MVVYLDLTDLLASAEKFLGQKPQIRDAGLLDSALHRPAATMYGVEAYPEFHQKAAALLVAVTNNHGLVDGNKRLGWVATRLFYAYNGYQLRMDHDRAYELVMGIADGTLVDVPQIAQLLEASTSGLDYLATRAELDA